MALPPPTYFLLLAMTLVAWPLVRRGLAEPGMRRATGLLLGGLLVFEASLIVLFYSRAACAVGVVAACILLARFGHRSWWVAGLAALPAAAAGAAFVAAPEPQAYIGYFTLGLPASLLVALAVALGAWLRWASSARLLLAAAAALLAAAMVPWAAFSISFLERFEVAYAPVLVLALAALSWLARGGAKLRAAGRDRPADLDGAGGIDPPGVARLGLLRALALLVGGAATAAAGLLLAYVTVDVRAPAETAGDVLRLIGGGGIAAAGTLAAAVGLAACEAARSRRNFHRRPWAGPAGSVRLPPGTAVEQASAATPAVLDDLRARLAAAGSPVGALVLDMRGPFETLPAATLDWLTRQRGPVRVHVVLREGDDAFVLPPILPGEGDP